MSIQQTLELSQAETRMINEAVFEKLSSNNGELVKEATDAVNDFTRTKMRERGFLREIIPPVPIRADQLTRRIESDSPSVVIDKEGDSPAAVSVPFAQLPVNQYIRGYRYLVTLSRIQTPRFTKDVDQLATWIMDIRQVLSDNAIKDLLAEEDGKFILAVNSAMVAQGATVATSGTVQWESIGGGITRDGLSDMMKIMPGTPSHLDVHTVLINNITVNDLVKFNRIEMGGDLSQEIFRNGWSLQEFMGRRWLITIKTDIIPTNSFFHFADPKFIGKHFSLTDTTMYIRREAFMLEFFAYQTSGATLGHTSGLTRADFT